MQARYIIVTIVFTFIKVDIIQINHFGKEKSLNYIDRTGNPCTLEYELLIYTKLKVTS